MKLDIFSSTKHWTYTADDELAEISFSQLQKQARESLPKQFFERSAPLLQQSIKKTLLYHNLKSLPKGVLHNVFFDCCDDRQFYRKYIIEHPNVYVTNDYVSFRIGTKKQAQKYDWISMQNAKKQFKNEDDFLQAICGITMFNNEELKEICKQNTKVWSLFQNKIAKTHGLIYHQDICKQYTKHILRKFAKNGYLRIQFRSPLVHLFNYDSNGALIGKLPQKAFTHIFDEAFNQIKAEYPELTVGFIFCIKKSLSEPQIQKQLEKICKLQWSRTIGLDFVEQQDLYGSLQKYDKIAQRVLKLYPDTKIWKAYHAGQTKNHLSKNIQEAIQAGSVRIGHGLNILQRVQFLPFCKYVCFEKCPISNLLLGYTGDPRQSSAPILLGLGYAVSINIGSSGKFGVEDGTADLFVSAVSYDWTLKNLKLIALHSINHSLCRQKQRRKMLKDFEKDWNNWINNFLKGIHQQNVVSPRILDIFGKTNNWNYTKNDEKAERFFQTLRQRQISNLPEGFFKKTTLTHLQHIRNSQFYELLKDLPKGVLHHDHFDCNQDQDFYRDHIVTDPNIYLAADKKSFKIGPKEEAQKEGWISFDKVRRQFQNERKFIKFVSNLTMLSKEQLYQVSGRQHEFWVIFEEKISNFFIIVFALHIFKKYVRHTLLKYIKNGYQRIQFRALLSKLNQYDENGNFIKSHDEAKFIEAYDEVYFEVIKQYKNFTTGFIFFGLKALSEEQNFQILDKACSYQWPRMIGIDFVQQEDPYGSMQPYIKVGDKILKKWSHLNLKKVYHAGQTKDHLNNNVQLSVRSGAVRIGHGLNIVKRIQYLNECKGVCFQLNPISNLLTGGLSDIRMSSAPLLLGLGYAVSISPDDPGKFGYQDTTVDYYISAVSFNWTLKHLKLIAYHSINYAVVNEGQRLKILQCFNENWDKWIEYFLDVYERFEFDEVCVGKRRGEQLIRQQKQSYKRRVPMSIQRTNSY